MNPPAHRLTMLIQTGAVSRLAAAGGADDELRETHDGTVIGGGVWSGVRFREGEGGGRGEKGG